jgi:hypothetical protein
MKITIEELEKRLKDRIVGQVLENMIMDIDSLPPDGAKAHKRDKQENNLYWCLRICKERGLSDKTFEYPKVNDKEMYDITIRLIKDTMEYLNLTI